MPTQPLKQILEQANLPLKVVLSGYEGLIFVTGSDGEGDAVGEAFTPEIAALFCHSVNNLSRAIEALKAIKAKLVSIDESAEPFNEPDTQPIHDLIDETLADLETVQTP